MVSIHSCHHASPATIAPQGPSTSHIFFDDRRFYLAETRTCIIFICTFPCWTSRACSLHALTLVWCALAFFCQWHSLSLCHDNWPRSCIFPRYGWRRPRFFQLRAVARTVPFALHAASLAVPILRARCGSHVFSLCLLCGSRWLLHAHPLWKRQWLEMVQNSCFEYGHWPRYAYAFKYLCIYADESPEMHPDRYIMIWCRQSSPNFSHGGWARRPQSPYARSRSFKYSFMVQNNHKNSRYLHQFPSSVSIDVIFIK